MKKKENLWELLKRLDEQAGHYSYYLNEANRYFDTTAVTTRKLLEKQEKELHGLIRKIKKPLNDFLKQNERPGPPKSPKSKQQDKRT